MPTVSGPIPSSFCADMLIIVIFPSRSTASMPSLVKSSIFSRSFTILLTFLFSMMFHASIERSRRAAAPAALQNCPGLKTDGSYSFVHLFQILDISPERFISDSAPASWTARADCPFRTEIPLEMVKRNGRAGVTDFSAPIVLEAIIPWYAPRKAASPLFPRRAKRADSTVCSLRILTFSAVE